MNLEKKYEKCEAKVEKLKAELKLAKADNERLNSVIADIEDIKTEYEKELEKAKKCRKEYEILISQIRILRKALNLN